MSAFINLFFGLTRESRVSPAPVIVDGNDTPVALVDDVPVAAVMVLRRVASMGMISMTDEEEEEDNGTSEAVDDTEVGDDNATTDEDATNPTPLAVGEDGMSSGDDSGEDWGDTAMEPSLLRLLDAVVADGPNNGEPEGAVNSIP
jgi:hypothetical protein